MFKWFIKPKVDVVRTTQKAISSICDYVDNGEHTELVKLFRRSIIDNEDQVQYLMTEIHIGSVLQKLFKIVTQVDIFIYSGKMPDSKCTETIFVNEKYITDTKTMINILVQMSLMKLGYKNDSDSHLPTMLGRFISESSKV